MQTVSRTQFTALLKEQRVKSRLVRDVRFSPEDVPDWDVLEMIAVSTRNRADGVLLMQLSDFYLVPYELMTGLKDNSTGRSKPITCDLCRTWQAGSNAGCITFRRAADNHTFTFLCCADLQCSLHIRDLTPEATVSRAQLHEDIDAAGRIKRLTRKLQDILGILQIQSTSVPET